MTANEAIDYFRQTYPGKNIVALPENDPTEIICEVSPTAEHPERNTAIAAIKISTPHFHKKAVETYKILDGTLELYIDNTPIILKVGEMHVIQPGQVHYAKGDFALVEVTSEPGWTPEDHILATSI